MSEDTQISRRGLFRGLVGGASVALLGGLAAGYRYRAELRAMHVSAGVRPLRSPDAMGAFRERAARIRSLYREQTAAESRELSQRYSSPFFGRIPIWDLVEKLALCIDESDTMLFSTSQYVHVQQILAAMEANGATDPDLTLVALLHDVGKVAILAGVPQEHVMCGAAQLSEGERGAGLDTLTYGFGHAELAYQKLKAHLPEPVAWVIRYHNVGIRRALPYMTPREREWNDRYLVPFRRFDTGFKSPYFHPRVEMGRYRDLLESRFPDGVVF